ncbi:MAG: chemotaxis response regulator protein-glutamate methylesterase [Treponema sp.]|uniref:protein-glutamate methylesterase/protein-glutamine glutaminase n=1 Tax=Treponema sp. TaxID=166 RepID=UPI00298E253C|nr:chemotaxis response regulator protein-glutamate methylesterase [Treponema sp.]MBR5932609.1 chemotaxis response regulator protein-glutamate methylesterase [Treponema sp.]
MKEDISVLVCDDSALMRNLISRIIENTQGLSVCAKAMNGEIALQRVEEFKPDVIVLDIEMPVMSGIDFLKERKKRRWDVPVIILSSIATEGATVTMEALELGASDFLTKPNGSVTADLSSVADRLVELISSYGFSYAAIHGKDVYEPDFFIRQIKLREAERFVLEQKKEKIESLQEQNVEKITDKIVPVQKAFEWNPPEKKEPMIIKPLRDPGRIQIIAIGISTGGPNALREVFKLIDPHLKQPVLVVQHMPAGFTREFAMSLDRICPLKVHEAEDGQKVEGGNVYIAPGNYHIKIERKLDGNVIRLSQDPQRNGHRPSADVLFESVAEVYKNNALGVIMTGMGRDGAAELAEMRTQGAWTIGQDEKTSIVYGMPKVAYELGAVQRQVPLSSMADEISALAREHL